MIICKEVLEAAGPVDATGQQTKHALLAAHVAVPRVLFDGRMCRPWTDEKVDAFHAETPAGKRFTVSPSGLQPYPTTVSAHKCRNESFSTTVGCTREHDFVISIELCM